MGVMPPPAQPDFVVKLELSLRDRWFPATMLAQIPWGGGERTVTSLGTIWEALKLESVPVKQRPHQLPTELDVFELRRADAEMLITVVCGGIANSALSGEVGPALAKLVARVRGMITAQTPVPPSP